MDQGFVQQKSLDVSIQQQADKTHTKKNNNSYILRLNTEN